MMFTIYCKNCEYSSSVRGWIEKEDYEHTKWSDLSLEEFEELNRQVMEEIGKPLVYDPVDRIVNSSDLSEDGKYATCTACGHQTLIFF